MRRFVVPFTFLAVTCAFMAPAAAQETKTARGTVTALTGTTLTIDVTGTSLAFAVDDKTRVEAPGAGTATRRAQAAGQAGVKIADVVKTGNAVEVTYTESGGSRHATQVRRISSPGSNPMNATRSNGKVTAVSASSLSISGSGGAGSQFTQTFAIDASTRVVGKGAGTVARASGGKVPITDLVSVGDSVSVAFRKSADTLHATSVTVTTKAAAK
jgi:hypothetical protein